MRNLGASALWGLAIGSSLVVGAVVAARTSLPPAVAEFVTAFGGGVLFAAIALELVPAADEAAGPAWTAAGLISGTLVYVAADAWLTRDETRKLRRRAAHGMAAGRAMDDEMSALRSAGDHAQAARGESIAVGLFIDGVPESLALGLTVGAGEVAAALAAGIVIGNVVEAYGAARLIVAGGHSRSFAVGLLATIGASLAVATVVGGTLLADAAPELVGTAQAVAAGAVLSVVSIQIIPHAARSRSRRSPASRSGICSAESPDEIIGTGRASDDARAGRARVSTVAFRGSSVRRRSRFRDTPAQKVG